MKQIKRYWFLGVVVIMALLFAGMTFAKEKGQLPSREEFQSRHVSQNIARRAHDVTLSREDFKANPDFSRPAFKEFQKAVNAKKGIPTPESLCDNGYYWMGGPAWTADTDGNAIVWGAGGNLYFASASDPTHPVEWWWGDVPLRIRIHNGIALVFSLFYTYSFDVSDPLNPMWLSYGPGAYFGFLDAYPSPDDSYWILTDWAYSGGLTVWDPATYEYVWDVVPFNGGWFWDIHIDDEQKVAICGDWWSGYYEFWDVSDLMCAPPTYIGSFEDYGSIGNYGQFNTGLIFYKDEYLYGNFEAWQSYNWILMNWVFGWPTWQDDASWISIYHVPNLHDPANNYYVRVQHDDSYDVVSMKRADNNILLTHYQNRVGLWTDQFETHLKSGFFGTTAGYATLDGAYIGGAGVVACQEGGARFFADASGGTFQNTGEYWTGGLALDVIPNGNYLYVPSGYAGLGIIDNTDPTYPVTYSHLWDFTGGAGIWYAAVSNDGNYVYVTTDNSQYVWVIDVTDKLNPKVVSTTNPYDTGGAIVQRLIMLGDMLVIGTTNSVQLVDVTNPSAPVLIDEEILLNGGGATMVKSFDHPSYPDQLFLAVTSDDGFLYTFYFDGAALTDSGSVNLGIPLFDVVTVGQMAYATNAIGTIYPARMLSLSPNIYFDLNRTGVTDLPGHYNWSDMNYPPFDRTRLAQINSQYIAVYGDHLVYHYPAIFVVDVGTDPLAPHYVPSFPPQPGVMPIDFLTGMNSQGDYVYYATDWFGTGALSFHPDVDMPTVVSGPTITPPAVSDVAGHLPDPTGGWLQGTVKLSVTVSDTTTAITKVVFKFYDGKRHRWQTIKTMTSSTPAGQNGVYEYNWDTTKWIYIGTGPSPIRVEVTDSGCNTLIYDTPLTYAINLPPSYEIIWDHGCNEPPVGGICDPAGAWIVCGDLCFKVSGYVRDDAEPYHNEAPADTQPIDDVSQIAYRIDGGSWVLYPVPIGLLDGDANPWWDQYICIDTTALADGSHTLEIRVADDCGLHGYKDLNGQSSWTFTVDNDGPQPYITAPMSGDIVKGSAIRVAAKMHNELAARPVNLVKFYLDSTDTTTIPQIIATGTLIGSATTKDESGEFSFTWDATSVPYGDHILTAVVWESGSCSCGPYRTPIVSFNLVSYVSMTVTATAAPASGNAPLATVLAASVTGGQEPYTYAWDFGDGQTGTGNLITHTYTTAGSYTATVTVTDNTGATATGSVAITVSGNVIENPVITSVTKATNPFRLHIYGSKFKPGCVVKINGVAVPYVTYKDSTHVVAKKGAALKAMCPKGVTVKITVENPDGGVSNEFSYTR